MNNRYLDKTGLKSFFDKLYAIFQPRQDMSLSTSSKNIVSSINEVNENTLEEIEDLDGIKSHLYGVPIASLRTKKVLNSYNRLTLPYDAANFILGQEYRLPTAEEMTELIENCYWEYYDENNTPYFHVPGYKVISKTNATNNIFLPLLGLIDDTELRDIGKYGHYWTSQAIAPDKNATALYLAEKARPTTANINRNIALQIRPVAAKSTSSNDFVDLGLSVKWCKHNIGAINPYNTGIYFPWGEVRPHTKSIAHKDNDEKHFGDGEKNQIFDKLNELSKREGVYTFMGTVETYSKLPVIDLVCGHIYLVKDEDKKYVWIEYVDQTGTVVKAIWEPLGSGGGEHYSSIEESIIKSLF